MELIIAGGHTFDQSLLSDGVIIDVGCRGFEFSDHFKQKVYCIDVDPDIFDREPKDNQEFMNVAISKVAGDTTFYRNGEATCLTEIYTPLPHLFTDCKAITMQDLYKVTGNNVDVLKIDAEGAEYYILGDGFEPIPKQITVEFHEHLVPEFHRANIDKCMGNLLKHYIAFQNERESRHGCGMNAWDSLFIRKDLC